MSRSVSASMLTEINANANRSCWLVMIGFDTELYCCNWPVSLSWDSQTWQPLDVRVSGIGSDKAGASSATLSLGNADNVASALVLAGGLQDRDVDIYLAYVDADDAVIEDPELLLAGRTDGGTIYNQEAVIYVLEQKSARYGNSPGRWITPDNGFNHLPPDGQTIEWKGEKYVLRARGV